MSVSNFKYQIPPKKFFTQSEKSLISLLFEKNLAMSPIFLENKETCETLFNCNFSTLINPQDNNINSKMNIFSTITECDGISKMLSNC